jgi:septal ring factor EnvC (AmiA/AmiB activator)
MPVSRDLVPCDPTVCPDLDSKVNNDKFLELQSALEDKSNQLNETDTKLKAVMEEVAVLKRELEANRKLLDESQVTLELNKIHILL